MFSLAPKWEELAQLYTSDADFNSKVTVAKCDATANDVPDEIAGFPSIKLYPAGAKGSPVEYSGSRTVEDMAAFIRDNGKHGVAAYKPEAETDAEGDVTMAEGTQETMAKAAPAATTSTGTTGGVVESIKSAASEAASVIADVAVDDAGELESKDEL